MDKRFQFVTLRGPGMSWDGWNLADQAAQLEPMAKLAMAIKVDNENRPIISSGIKDHASGRIYEFSLETGWAPGFETL